jgi:hypothetical protein
MNGTLKDVEGQAIKVVWGRIRRLRALRTLTLRKLPNPYVLENSLKDYVLFYSQNR